MRKNDRSGKQDNEFDNAEGLALALNYLSDPSDVPCPTCGPGTVEVVAFLDAGGISEGVVRSSPPEGEYTVVLYCHDCRRAAALDLSPDGLPGGLDPHELDEGTPEEDADDGYGDDRYGDEGFGDRWAA